MSHRQQPRPQCVVCTAASLLTPVWPETTSSECRSTGSALLSAGLSSAPAMPAGFAPKPSVKDGQRLLQHFWPSTIAYIQAAQVSFLPEAFDYSVLRRPFAHLGSELQAVFGASNKGVFTVFEHGSKPRARDCHRDWLIEDYVADAVGSASRPVRSVQILARPIEGMPRPQLVITHAEAPWQALAIPYDLRQTHGHVVTAHTPPAVSMAQLPEHIRSGAPLTAALDFAQGPLAFVTDATGRRHDFLAPPLDRFEWLLLHFVGPVCAAENAFAVDMHPASSTTTTTQMQPTTRRNRSRSVSASPEPRLSRDPPTLLGAEGGGTCSGAGSSTDSPAVDRSLPRRPGTYLEPRSQFPQVLACPRRPDRHAVQRACQVHVTPERAAHVLQPPTPLHMHAWTGFLPVVDTTPGCSLAHYTLFDVLGHARIRRAVADWTLSEVLADILAILPDTVSVRVLTHILPGLPPLQIVARPRHASDVQGVLPVDLRPTGGVICTLLADGGAEHTDMVQDVVARCRTPPVPLSAAEGGPFDRLPLVADDAEYLYSGDTGTLAALGVGSPHRGWREGYGPASPSNCPY